MSRNRYLRILTILGEDAVRVALETPPPAEGEKAPEKPMKIEVLTKKVNKRFEKDYSTGVILLDSRELIARGWIKFGKSADSVLITERGQAEDLSSLDRKPRWSVSQPGQLMAA